MLTIRKKGGNVMAAQAFNKYFDEVLWVSNHKKPTASAGSED